MGTCVGLWEWGSWWWWWWYLHGILRSTGRLALPYHTAVQGTKEVNTGLFLKVNESEVRGVS